jgi:hypothetical protein
VYLAGIPVGIESSGTERTAMEEKAIHTETIEVSGDDLVAKIKDLVHEGNVRRIIIKNEEGEKLIELPLTVGVVGAILLPTLAAVGAVAALLSKCTIEVEREAE